jgi:uncharacterized protein YacL
MDKKIAVLNTMTFFSTIGLILGFVIGVLGNLYGVIPAYYAGMALIITCFISILCAAFMRIFYC